MGYPAMSQIDPAPAAEETPTSGGTANGVPTAVTAAHGDSGSADTAETAQAEPTPTEVYEESD
eukprot:2068434-Prymnesium_polylepis.1